MLRTQDLLPGLAATAGAVFLGSSFVAIRFVIDETEPATLAFIRFVIAALCIAPFTLTGARALPAPRHLLVILLLGVLQFGLFQYLVNSALRYIAASRGAVIFSLIPILTMAIATAMRYEAPTWSKAFAAALSIIGISLALGEKAFAPESGTTGSWTGELFFLVAVCCGASYNALSAPYLQRYTPAQVAMWAMVGGVVFLAIPAGAEGAFDQLPRFSLAGWLSVAFLAIPASAVSFFLFTWALKRLAPTRTAVFVPLSPIVATVLGAALLGERISALFVAGLVCIVISIWLANRRVSVSR